MTQSKSKVIAVLTVAVVSLGAYSWFDYNSGSDQHHSGTDTSVSDTSVVDGSQNGLTNEPKHESVATQHWSEENHDPPVVAELTQSEHDHSRIGDGRNYISEALDSFHADPSYIGMLFEQYFQSNEIRSKRRIESQLSAISTFSDEGAAAERFILDNILKNYGMEQDRWAELLGVMGVRSPQVRAELLEALSVLDSQLALGYVIGAVLPVHPSVEEKQNVVQTIQVYTDHSDSHIRAAAINSVAMWGNQEHAVFIENGLNDPDSVVRHAAATASLLSDIRSSAIKELLIQISQSDTETPNTQQQALSSLSNYKLNEIEFQLLDVVSRNTYRNYRNAIVQDGS